MKLFARRTRQKYVKQSIISLKDEACQEVTDPIGITSLFESYYQLLYYQENTADPNAVNNYLGDFESNLSMEDNKMLTADTTLDEVNAAVAVLPAGKDVGPDGIL